MSNLINSVNAINSATSAITTASAVVNPETVTTAQRFKNFIHNHKGAVIAGTAGAAVAVGGTVVVIKNKGKLNNLFKKCKKNETTV